MTWNPEVEPYPEITVRNLAAGDLGAIVRMDAAEMGRSRDEYYRTKIEAALEPGGPHTSLVAEIDEHAVGFVLARVYYGEFGQAEPVAMIDSVGVDPPFRGRHVGQCLLEQLIRNLRGLHVERIQTQVDWDRLSLLQFLRREGFAPAPRICLERAL